MKKLVVLLIVCFVVVLTSQADDKKQSEKQPEYYPKLAISEHHKLLQGGIGEWKFTQKMWGNPDEEPMTATGTSVCKPILGGRGTIVFVESSSEVAGTFQGFGVFTWNSKEEKYECSWVDVYSYYGIDSMEGTHDPKTNTTTWTSTMKDPTTGAEMAVSMVETYPNEDTMISTFYMHIGQNKIKTMQNTYTRIKKDNKETKETAPKKE
ncbi:DUF1579 family protein [Candidatus Uabimicrobium amorphum]|uniref:DUF1579 domain-containing protein n=1 Tax=Uabimicrobium amorphum TaxID=2596890 RepID=A0A5S9F436_UABAM|nr:DUF1579 family protein [Candidatus Uabimicrobium amorphum]BBM84753.1 hypothetical protein UABAM_03114 [Candidatus Uabimicrobium amorphum]